MSIDYKIIKNEKIYFNRCKMIGILLISIYFLIVLNVSEAKNLIISL